MNYYKKGRKYTDKGRFHLAKGFFEIGISKGCPKCAYGIFALKMSIGADARYEWEYFVDKLSEIDELAKNTDADACFIMGRCFETGCGGECDINKAAYWYEKAAGLGNVDAMYNLGCMYINDDNMKDIQKGVVYFKRAANANLKEAQFNLAHIYEQNGNIFEATLWYGRARRGGTDEMKEKYVQWCSETVINTEL